MSYGFYRIGGGPNRLDLYRAALLADAGQHSVVTDTAAFQLEPASRDMLLDSEVSGALDHLTARAQGFTGNQCTICNSMRMQVSGHCEVCQDCGSSSGCS